VTDLGGGWEASLRCIVWVGCEGFRLVGVGGLGGSVGGSVGWEVVL
jgi:hypothetical protein